MRALTIGSAMVDIITLVDSDNIEKMRLQNDGKSYLLLEQGRKIVAKSITTHIGGGACNVAISLSRQGWHVKTIAKLGEDINGRAITAHMDNNGVDTQEIRTIPDVATGISSMIAAHDRNATIFVHRGANECLAQDDIPMQTFTDMDLTYVSALSNASADLFPQIVQQASGFLAVNPGIRQITARTQAFFKALPHISLLSVNRVEAQALIPGLHAHTKITKHPVPPGDIPPLLKRGLQFGGFDVGLIDFAKALHTLGINWVLVTDGLDGAYLFNHDYSWWCPALPDVQVKGTAGAGDAFCSTLASELAQNHAPEDALTRATLNAAAVVGQINTTDGLMDTESLSQAANATDINIRSL